MPNGASRRLVLAATFAFLVVGAGSAIAGTGVGDVFNLGETNTVNKESVLRGNTNAPMLSVDNTRDDAAAMGVDATSIGGGTAVSGTNAGAGYGVRGSSSSGTGVLGLHSNVSGARAGVQGQTRSRSANAAGVRGLVTATGPGSLSAGVRGEISDAASSAGAGVYARHAGNGYGLQSVAEGPFGYGLFSSGGSYGVFLQASAPQPARPASTPAAIPVASTPFRRRRAEPATACSPTRTPATVAPGSTAARTAAPGSNFGVRGEVFSPDRLRRPFREQRHGQLRHRRHRARLGRGRQQRAGRLLRRRRRVRRRQRRHRRLRPGVGLRRGRPSGLGTYAGYFVGNAT